MNEIIHANPEQQKDILWKKYLSKKKSFAKARLAVDDFTRLDQPEFQKWVSTFAEDVQSEIFLNQYYVERYDERMPFSSLSFSISGLTLDEIYANFICQLNERLADSDSTDLKEAIQPDKDRQKLELQIARLNMKMKGYDYDYFYCIVPSCKICSAGFSLAHYFHRCGHTHSIKSYGCCRG